MKINKKYILLFIIFLSSFSFLFFVLIFNNKLENYKDTGLYISCDNDSISNNNKVSCELYGVSNENMVSAVSSKIVLSDNLSLEDVQVSSVWEGDGNNGDVILYTDKNKIGNFDILKFNVSLKNKKDKNGSISIENIEFFDEKFKSHGVSNNKIDLKVM